MLRRAGRRVREQWLGQPLADVLLAPDARRAQVVDRQARDHGREKCLGRLDLHPLRLLAMQPQERLLDQVLGVADRPDHAVGQREQQRPQVFMCVCHARHGYLVSG